ncbi:DUF1189 family protein [Macrococcus brunensis]|uniref:DUF1189 family protein n=1 Tax=Macrococcus brunensis TaxID=198483 RepID=UPI001EEFB5C1|nr:DUF1189 family protein [Macrococcus brunensis]ULG73443.1 DUF1189 domain-containing protein [Macrococcus brunensis]
MVSFQMEEILLKYQLALTRLFKPKKYALYRTTPLRYIFLHLFILSALLAAPAASQFFQSMTSLSQLIADKSEAIPDFTIKNAKLSLPQHQDTVIHLNNGTVTFTEQSSGLSSDQFTFSKEHIMIKGIDPISYHNFSTITDRESMLETLTTFSSSIYFYFGLITVALILIQLFIILIKLASISLVAHLAALVLRKKSRYMNWLKITTFLLTPAVLIQYTGILVPNTLTYPLSWCIIILLTCLAIYHLPVIKKARQTN